MIAWFRLLGLERDGSSVDSRPVGLKENGGDRVCENVAVPTNHHLPAKYCLLSHSPVQDFLCVYSSGKHQPRGGAFGAALKRSQVKLLEQRQIV